jgi:hypothetical protein
MNPSRKVLCGLLLTAQIIYAAGASADTPVDASTGSITFRDRNNNMCVIDMPDYGAYEVYRLLDADNSLCKDKIKETRSWSLAGLPSATFITLSSDKNCVVSSAQDVVIELKTNEKKVFTPIREIKVLGDYSINGFVNPGLQLKSRHVKSEANITDSIKCMIIKTPTKPPAPPSSPTP